VKQGHAGWVAVLGAKPSLGLVTCGPQLEVAFAAPVGHTTSLVRLGGVSPRSTLVLAAVDLLIEDAELAPNAVARVVVSRGPGSFTGIRAGLATAFGLAAAIDAECLAYGSLLMLAARCAGSGSVWCAQPGRRGEVYARQFELPDSGVPRPLGEIEIMPLTAVTSCGPWSAAEALDLGAAERAPTIRSAAEALLHLASMGAAPDALEPLYVEGPPIHGLADGP
jgi:tRNA threonylcarbamoyl adenosine modification protein YeaZ